MACQGYLSVLETFQSVAALGSLSQVRHSRVLSASNRGTYVCTGCVADSEILGLTHWKIFEQVCLLSVTTSTRRRGWRSIADDEGEDDRSVPTRSIPGRATGDLLTSPKRRATWCTLITVLQRKGVAGLRMASAGYGQPVGNGTYFVVSRHQIGS